MLSVMVKPVSGSCQMRCGYCFYADEAKNRCTPNYGVMSEETLEKLVDRVFAWERQAVSFAFQGGEPTLAGIGFFRRFVSLVEEKNERGIPVYLSMQTNGYAIGGEWADFLAENRFLVGLSVDGTQRTHDRWRLDAEGAGTYGRVIRAAELLRSRGCEFNILTVVTRQVAESISEIYESYREHGFLYQQYIPCMDGIGEERGTHPWSLTPETYGEFLKTLFSLYKEDMLNGRYVYIRRFENWCAMSAGCEPEECCLCGRCSPQLLVEADGGVYPCDFYVLDGWKMGNIRDCDIPQLISSDAARGFFGFSPVPDECRQCRWRFLCRGGCRRERGQEGAARSIYCEALRDFFGYAARDMARIYVKWQQYTQLS